jgi:hypothetical protein
MVALNSSPSIYVQHGSHVPSQPAFLIWLWLILAAVAIGVPAIVITVAVLLRARAARSVLPQQDSWPVRAGA